jgi:hypothetical protein
MKNKTTKTNREHLTLEGKEQKLLNAYTFWEKNPHMLVDDLCKQFKTNRKDLGSWLLNNSKGRPDGRIIGKGSPRQVAIKEAYEAAAKKGQSVGWAVTFAKKTATSISPGDFRYYAMKNNLPDLKEAPATMQASPNKKQL